MNMLPEDNDRVPLFRSWNRWYVFVVIILVLEIGLFYLLTQHFA